MKYFPSKKEADVFYYDLANGERRWRVRYRYREHGKNKEKSKSGFTSEKAAIRYLLELKTALLKGNERQLEAGSMTVAQWLDLWYEANRPHWKVSTYKQYEMFIRRYFKPLLGHIRLNDLTRDTYQRVFINVLLTKCSSSSVKTFHTVFKTAINAAVEDDILEKNRLRRIKISKPSDEEKKLYYYTAEQLEGFLSTARERVSYPLYIAFLLLAYTGMRRGELLALWHDDFNFLNNTITINKTRDRNGVRPPKTKNSYRVVSVDPGIMQEVKAYQTWTKKTCLYNGISWSGADFALISPSGLPLSQQAFYYPLKKVQEAADIPKIPVHGLRHTHATLLMLNPDISVKAIAERLGNTVDMIYRIYGHVLKEMSYSTMLAFSTVMKSHLEMEKMLQEKESK